MMVKISVIVPVYNVEKYITRCVDSILSQSFRNFELILVNDGSNDKSLEIIEKYKGDKRVKIFTQKNQGPAIARNLGISKASGKYVMFIDSDDFIDKDYFEKYYNYVNSKDYDIVIGGYKRYVDDKVQFTLKLKQGEFSKYVITGPVCRIIKMEFLKKNNINFLDTNSSEDIYFNLMIYNKTDKIGIINYSGYYYFYNSASISNTKHKGFKKDIKIIELLDLINVDKSYNLELNQYFIIRYVIWYLLYSGRTATPENFMFEYKKLFGWLEKNIPDYKKNQYFRFKIPKGEVLKYGLTVRTFMFISNIKLVNLFSRLYCKGR